VNATWKTYHKVTRTATYSFLAALPLLVLYEAMIVFANRGQVRVGAEVWMKYLLSGLGISGLAVLGGIVLVVGIAVFVAERKKQIPIRPQYFGWIVAESTLYGVFLAFLVSSMVGMVFAGASVQLSIPLQVVTQPQVSSFWTNLALSIGAGLYEELLFRVLIVGGLFAVLKYFVAKKAVAYIVAAVAGALLFSAVHYVGALGDTFTLVSFTYRFLFGLALNAVYLLRGFGVAAWTHALYDVMVVTHLLG
jgi:hypothetical protein